MEQNIHARFDAKHNEMRLAIMDFIIEHGRAYNPQNDGYSALRITSTSQEFQSLVRTLIQKEGLVCNAQGDITCAYPVSSMPTRHKVTLADGRQLYTMCAIDALGSAFTFKQDVHIETLCGHSNTPIFIDVKDEQISDASSKDVHIITFHLDQIVNWSGSC
ncbi:MAG: MerB-like organometallic lyase SaoL [Pseudomonadota bacterium]